MWGKKRQESEDKEQENAHRVATTEIKDNKASKGGVYTFYWLVFALAGFGTFFAASSLALPLRIVLGVVAGFIFGYTFRVTPQWERVVIRGGGGVGKFNRIAGPGFFCCIPFIEHVSITCRQRIITSSFPQRRP